MPNSSFSIQNSKFAAGARLGGLDRAHDSLEIPLSPWERIYNPHFKVVEFDHFKSEAGLPSFVLSPSQWVEKTGADRLLKLNTIAIRQMQSLTANAALVKQLPDHEEEN